MLKREKQILSPQDVVFFYLLATKYPEHANDASVKEQLTKLNSLTFKEASQLFDKLKPKCPKGHGYCITADSENNKKLIGEPCDVKSSAKCTGTVKIPFLICKQDVCKIEGKEQKVCIECGILGK